MMKLVLALLMGLNFTITPIATVDRIEGDYAVVEVGTQMVDVPTEDFNNPIAEGNKISISMAVGRFTTSFVELDGNTYYQFKAYDDTIWWVLTPEEIGFTPEADKTYVLTYCDNGTTDCTECAKELDCECEVYDDIFLAVKEVK